MGQTNLLHLLNKRQHVFEYDTDNIPDKQKFEKNYLYINSKTKKNIILPKFEELFF